MNTVKGNILAGKYSCGEIFPRGNILADLEIFFQTCGFFPTRIFPYHRRFLRKPAVDQKSKKSVCFHRVSGRTGHYLPIKNYHTAQ